MDEATMDEILSDVLHKEHPKLYQYLAVITLRGVPIDAIMECVATRCAVNSLTYLSILGTLHFFHRKMEAKRGETC